jgi:hypothetical protein
MGVCSVRTVFVAGMVACLASGDVKADAGPIFALSNKAEALADLVKANSPQATATAASVEGLLEQIASRLPVYPERLPEKKWEGFDASTVRAGIAAWAALGDFYRSEDNLLKAETAYRRALSLDLAVEDKSDQSSNPNLTKAFIGLLDLYVGETASGMRDIPEFISKISNSITAEFSANIQVRLPSAAKQRFRQVAETKLFHLLPRFGPPPSGSVQCSGKSLEPPSARALLVGNDDTHNFLGRNLEGSINDVKLVRKALEARGGRVDGSSITILENVTRDQALNAMDKLVDTTKCGDSVLFHFSGANFFDYTSGLLSQLPPGLNLGLVFTDASRRRLQMITGMELSEFVTAIRNRGANVFLFLDTGRAAAASIGQLQARAASPLSLWSANASPEEEFSAEPGQGPGLTPVMPGAGAFAAFYAADIDGEAMEFPLGGGTNGIFSFALAKVLQTEARPTVREIAKGIAAEYGHLRKAHNINRGELGYPVFEASDPDLVFLEPKRALPVETLPVEVLTPKLNETRGVLIVETPKFEMIARVPGAASIALLTLNHQPVTLDSNGQFKAQIELAPGENKVVVAATGFDFHIRTKTLEFTYEGDLNRFAAVGKRYALVAGVRTYDHPERWRMLETPLKDATEVAKTLRDLYGFETEIEVKGGKKVNLLLLDPTGREITSALSHLRQVLTENDSLLIYYAGHGVRLPDNDRAYWIPKDGDSEDEYTWISSADLIDGIKRMNARSILVVADSCFSGAMSRSPPDLSSFSQDKKQALLKAGNRRSRLFMSSGGNEPVLDAGCKESADHSIFACAFLKGLREFSDSVFGARDFHQSQIFPIGGRTKQEPQFKELADSGHDGGEFIFARVEAQKAGREVAPEGTLP